MPARERALIRVRTLAAAGIETESERLLVTLAAEVESLTAQLQAAQAVSAHYKSLAGSVLDNGNAAADRLVLELQAAQATIAAIQSVQDETDATNEHDDGFWADWYQEKSERIDKVLALVTPTENGDTDDA